MTDLSIITIMGATIDAAVAPETKSEANRRPKFFVFHSFFSAKASDTFGVRDMIFGDALVISIWGVTGDFSPEVCWLIVGALKRTDLEL